MRSRVSMTRPRGCVTPFTNCSATETTLSEPPARCVRVVAALADDFAFLAPVVAAVAVPLAPERAALAVPAAADAAVLAVAPAAARVLRADRAVLAASDCAVVRVRAAPDLACVAVLPAAFRVLVAVDLAPVRAAAVVRCVPEPAADELVRLAVDLGDEERDEVEDERLAGGIVRGS